MFFFFKQKTAYEMRISDWSSECALPILILRAQAFDVAAGGEQGLARSRHKRASERAEIVTDDQTRDVEDGLPDISAHSAPPAAVRCAHGPPSPPIRHRIGVRQPYHRRRGGEQMGGRAGGREEPTSELRSLMRVSYAVFALK